MTVQQTEATIGGKTLAFETGKLALQADGAVVVSLGETQLLVTAVAGKNPKEGLDFLPLTVDVEERMYAAGKIPGGFFRREGRPSETAILTARLIDRPLRPSFAAGLRNEIHIIATILSADMENPPDVPAMNGASTAVLLAGIPFEGPVGAARVGLHKLGHWVINPTYTEIEECTFDLIAAGRLNESGKVDVLMVEAEATEHAVGLFGQGGPGCRPTEEKVVEALEQAKEAIRVSCETQREFVARVGAEPMDLPRFPDYGQDVYGALEKAMGPALAEALAIPGKAERESRMDELKSQAPEKVEAIVGEEISGREREIGPAFKSLAKHLVRERVVAEGKRIDGRGTRDIRPITCEVGLLPRAHGSGLFTRGETQVLTITTLGMQRMEQIIDTLDPDDRKRYMHHYNFPPFCTGETGFMRGPRRREIGHGALAERALLPVVPPQDEFPYAVRLVSEVLSSNGSSSMASVCGSALSLMDAGAPIYAPVAGVAMGLISEGGQYVTLTDILGAEDAYGDMDFKVAGTREFVTALQLDTKLTGIPSEVLAGALSQAREARLFILDRMAEAIAEPRAEMSPWAPRVHVEQIPVDKIGELIGPKGKRINEIAAVSGAEINIEDDGRVYVGSRDAEQLAVALRMIRDTVNPRMPAKGERFRGTVVGTKPFGAFVSLVPGKDGLLHISRMGKPGERVKSVDDVMKVGDQVDVEILDIDQANKISLGLVREGGPAEKPAEPAEKPAEPAEPAQPE
ncbi:MAG: polyribonucleotide nucleotidyltransferase [Actinomycetota bacterium]